MSGGGFHNNSDDEDSSNGFSGFNFGGMSGMGGMPKGGMGATGGMGGFPGMAGMGGSRGPRQASPLKRELPLSLEEFYSGCTKKLKVTRNILDASRNKLPAEKILTIDVKPGFKKGTKITFEKEGDEAPGMVPADIIFELAEKPHPFFTRDGDDLVYGAEISLKQALTGFDITIPTLDKRNLKVEVRDVVSPNYKKVIPNEGMPISKTNGTRKGNLIVNFKVTYPVRLTEEQKKAIKQVL